MSPFDRTSKRKDGGQSGFRPADAGASRRLLLGIHPVREALRAGRPLEKVVVAKGAAGPRVQELIELCRERTVPVRFEPKDALDRVSNGVPHQNVIGFGAAHDYAELDEVLEGSQLLVVLDGVEDPHNFGAIIRTAHAAGADAIVVGERRSAPLTETVERAAAGALAYLRVARVTNISQILDRLKERGFWIYGFDERGAEAYHEVQYTAPSVFVFGGEGKGLHQGVQKHCDVLVRIPMAGAVSSLNVSVACGVVLFDWRARNARAQ
ncbi:MAG: 23S rRNA (guanosine(2251)-2'-O)-methyltransferase RlmB [Bryobacteraceae bacterium]